ncbi:MAG: hypothetical protein V4492_03295 [Chlamydiota bacterium]
MHFTKPLLKIALAACAIYATQQFCHRKTDGFQITKTISTLPPQAEMHFSQETLASIQQILNQPFTYLGSGGQCYAFLSQDKKTVLKLFKMHHLGQHRWLQYCTLPGRLDHWRLNYIALQQQKIEKHFSSNTLAWEALKEESGLIHVSLNPGDPLTTTLIDKLHIAHPISLQNIPFVLQHYAKSPFKKLRAHIARKETAEAKKIVKSIVDALSERYQKGIIDLDPALRRNVGLLDGKTIFIDIGAFVSDPQAAHQKEMLWSETRRMDRWLGKRSVELKNYLDQLIAEKSLQPDDCQEGSNT